MSIYQRYLANQTLMPLVLTVLHCQKTWLIDMGVDSNSKLVCSGSMRLAAQSGSTQPDVLCRQGEMIQQQFSSNRKNPLISPGKQQPLPQ